MTQVVKKLTRQEKGKLLYETGKVHRVTDDIYFVESESQKDQGYEVLYTEERCECIDYEKRLEPCKHFFACTYDKTESLRKMLFNNQVKALSKIGEVKA